jgi:hypothetical protein
MTIAFAHKTSAQKVILPERTVAQMDHSLPKKWISSGIFENCVRSLNIYHYYNPKGITSNHVKRCLTDFKAHESSLI